jgi:AcrR family transcriptional regulator
VTQPLTPPVTQPLTPPSTQPLTQPSTRPRRRRRSQDEVRRQLLETARERFAARGYAGVSTRTIAADAATSETLIFSYFGNKAGLFEAAVLEPFSHFVGEFVDRFEAEPGNLEEETRVYVAGMYDLFRRQRKLVLALVAADAFDQDALEDKVTATFARLLAPIDDFVAREVGRRGWRRFDVPTIVRAMLGMIVSMAVLDNLFYDEPADRPHEELVVDQLTSLLVGGYHGLS